MKHGKSLPRPEGVMNIQVGIDKVAEANRFLRTLWAEFRKVCGKCAWQYTPYRDGPRNLIFLGFADIGRPEGGVGVSVTYVKKGSIRSICFTHGLDRPVDPQSDLGQLIQTTVEAARARMASPERKAYQVTVECLDRPLWFYEGHSFRMEPKSRRRFSLSVAVAAFDKPDAETQLIPRMRQILDLLSVETNSAFWPLLRGNDERDEPLEQAPDRSGLFVDDPNWMDDYPVRERLYLLSAEGKRLLELVAEEESLGGPISTFMRACNHFHTARKYDAQVTDVLEVGKAEPTGQAGEYVIPLTVRYSRLEAAGQLGAAHAEITGTLYMSALEIASKIGGPEPTACPKCGQQQFKISQRVTDLMTRCGGENLGRFAEGYYNQRSQYLHEGVMLSDLSYAGISIPLLDPSSTSGCRAQGASPSRNLREYVGFAMRRVLKEVVGGAARQE